MIDYLIYTLTLLAIYIMVNLSYAIPVGYTGLLNLGQIGLLAVGAYTAAILTTYGTSFGLALAAAAATTGLVGLLLALPARRIKGDYYALVTLGFTFVVNAVLLNWISLTNGPFGISGIQRPANFSEPASFLLLVLICLSITAAFVYRVVHSPFGLALEAVRDDDLTAESLGKPTAKLKIIALVVSAVIVGVSGGLLAHFIQFINPQVFWFDNVLWILAGLTVGGLASFWGAFLGMIVLYAMLEAIRFLPFTPIQLGPLRLIVFSLLLILVIIFRPKGIMGRAQL